MKLKISDDLSLPAEAVTQTFAILAKRGVGKTHTASVLAEEMLNIGQPIVVYDPVGAWWGLKASADGKREGFPVVIFGGEHADVPLEETAGATIATVIVERRIPAILDCSLLRKGARIRFMTDFCEMLYHKNREALHFFVDEAQTVAPQNLKAMPEAARLLGAMEDIVLQGRRRGLGMTIISPRPALVNTNLRSACEVIIAMQVIQSHDRKAIQEWVDVHGDDESRAKEMIASLSGLKRGEGWLWSPSWLELFQRVKFRGRETFDSSATPKVGQRIAAPKKLAAVDLDKLGSEIKATVDRAKADDPKELRRRIAELEKAKPVAAADAKAIEAARAAGERKGRDAAAEDVRQMRVRLTAAENALSRIAETATKFAHAAAAALKDAPPSPPPATVSRPIVSPERRSPPRPSADGDQPLGKAERSILFAFFWLLGEQATAAKVSFFSNYSATSSSFTNALGRLRSLGLVEGWRITSAGTQLAESLEVPEKPKGADLRDWLLQKLGRAERQILQVLIDRHPQRLSNAEISEASGYSATSSSFTNALGTLRTIEAAVGYEKDGGTKAADELF